MHSSQKALPQGRRAGDCGPPEQDAELVVVGSGVASHGSCVVGVGVAVLLVWLWGSHGLCWLLKVRAQ